MKKIYSIIFSLCFLSVISTAQERGGRPGGPGGGGTPPKATIKGKVLDADTQNPLEFATITLFSQRDSSIVSGGITNEKGEFLIDTRMGKLFAHVEFIGYRTLVIDDVGLKRGSFNADIGTVSIAPDSEILQEVEVRAERSEMTMSLDKRIFNVGKDLASAGGTAEDILDNVPSVTVDVEGNVSLRGAGGVRILVNGKPSALVSADNANGLRSIQANMIDRVEVVTNPSARYEAEGMAGIINIILKKNQKKGLNGSFDANAGYPENFGLGINLNYRKNRLNWFTNLSARFRNGPGRGSLEQEFFNTDLFSRMERMHERGGLSGNFRFGADYFFNPKSILTTAFSYQRSDEKNFSELTFLDAFGSFDNVFQITDRTDDEQEDEENLEYSLSYKKTFDRKGHEFKADFRYEAKLEEESSIFRENYFTPERVQLDSFLNQNSANEEGERRGALQLDYIRPFGENGKFELGYRGSIRNIDNDYEVLEEVDGSIIRNPDFSNNFIYDENIQALYATFGNKINKFSYQVGLRGEFSDVKTELKETNEINDRQYANLFPSAFLTYDLPNRNAVQLSYSRRVRRPRFWDLNPFFTLSDRRNIFRGNPNLDPEFTDSYEIGHIKYWEKGTLSSSIYYRHTIDLIQRIIKPNPDDDNGTIREPENIGTKDDYGLEFTFSYTPKKWWRINGDVNFFRSLTKGQDENNDLSAEATTSSFRLTSRTTLWKKVDVQLRGNYRAPRETIQGRNKGVGHLDFAANMDIWKNKGTITLSVRDVFNSRLRQYLTETDSFRSEGEFQWRARVVTLSLNYRLNQKKRRGRSGGRGGNFGGGEGGEF